MTINLQHTNSSKSNLIDIKKVMQHYRTNYINVKYEFESKPNDILRNIEPHPDKLLRLKAWITYDPEIDQLTISQYLIGADNYWITQFVDDHRNKRIDVKDYLYVRNT